MTFLPPAGRARTLRTRRHAPSVRSFRALALVLAYALLIAVLFAAQPMPLRAQSRHAQNDVADSLLSSALETAARGDTTAALKLLERANRISKKDPELLYWRALMLSRTTAMRFADVPRNLLAWNLLDRAESLDPGNPRYLMEKGRIRLNTPMLRLDAERMFRKAMAVAKQGGEPAQIADVAYELGQIKHRRYATAKDRYLITAPGQLFDPNEAINQKHYTREFLQQSAHPIDNVGSVDRSEAEEYYREGLRAVPTHEANAVGLLSLLYDQRRYAEMREVVRPFVEAGTGSARLRFAGGLAAYRTGASSDAQRLFDDALARLSEGQRRDAVDLSRIIRRRDALTYNALSPESRLVTDSAYWEAADPLLSTPENEGKLEFLSRVALADLRYSDADMRQVGWRTDRGLILIRYGEPPTVATFSPSSDADAADAVGRIITVWFYPTKERTYVFMGPPAMNLANFAGDMRGYAEENRENAPFLLDNVALAASVDTIPLQVARFRGAADNTTTLVVAAAVDTKALYRDIELAESSLLLSLRLGPASAMRLTRLDTVAMQLPAKNVAARTWSKDVPDGPYRIRVEAQDVAVQGAAARAQVEVGRLANVTSAFGISDAMLVARHDAFDAPVANLAAANVVPRGDVTLEQREVFSVYWENYGAVPDSAGRVHLDVRLQVTLEEIDRSQDQSAVRALGNIADALGLTREGEQTLGLRFTREEPLGKRDRIPMLATVGLGTSPSGRYRMSLQVTDRSTGAVSETERTFYLSRK